MRIENKVAVITGAASGIGRATAFLFAKEGAHVVVVDIDAQGGLETSRLIDADDGTSTFIQADLSKKDDAERVIVDTVRTLGTLDVLVNNAGIFKFGTVVECSEEDWDRMISINLKSVFLLSKYAIPEMVKAGGGSIINTASVGGLVGVENGSAYAAAKGGVIQLTKSMALDFGAADIRVNCICPGSIKTPMLQAIWQFEARGRSLEEIQKDYLQGRPLQKIGTPEDIAYAALYLASGESRFVTGTCLVVDGGIVAM